MNNLIGKIVKEVLEQAEEHHDSCSQRAVEMAVDRVLSEVYKILLEEQGSMNQRADHARHLATEIKWIFNERHANY